MKKKLFAICAAVILLFGAQSSMAKSMYSEWAENSISKASRAGIMKPGQQYDYQNYIKRGEFKEFIINYLEKYYDGYFDIMEVLQLEPEEVLEFLGIMEGYSEEENGDDDYLTREQAAVILDRMLISAKSEPKELPEFSDWDQVSDWAEESVTWVCQNGIMNGMDDGTFAPGQYITTEQVIATMVRGVELCKPGAITEYKEPETFVDRLNALMPEDCNYVISPFSIRMAMMMAANGASGETAEEILNAMDVENIDLYNEKARMMLDEYSKLDILKMNVANSLWINTDNTYKTFLESYTQKLTSFYDAKFDTVTNTDALQRVNGWVNEKTDGKIPSVLSPGEECFSSAIINAVYFNGKWSDEFSERFTSKDTFTSRNGQKSEIDFMRKTDYMTYSDTNGVVIIRLPYRSYEMEEWENFYENPDREEVNANTAMYVMMSPGEFNPEEELKNAEFNNEYVNLSLPKFSTDYSASLPGVLNRLGISKAFDSSAEFDRMFEGDNMKIGDVKHKTWIGVDEKGTEAAAVTVILQITGTLTPEPIDVKFNQPFTYVIKDDRNDEILFVGEYAFAE